MLIFSKSRCFLHLPLQAAYMASKIPVGMLHKSKIYIAEKMMDEVADICRVCSITSPSIICIVVPVAAENNITPKNAKSEIPNEIIGKTSPVHLFSFFDKFICKITIPAQIPSATMITRITANTLDVELTASTVSFTCGFIKLSPYSLVFGNQDFRRIKINLVADDHTLD
jgi:hypothetical protein